MKTVLTLDSAEEGVVSTSQGRAVMAEVQSLPGSSLSPQTKTDLVMKSLQEMPAANASPLLRQMLQVVCQRPAFDWAKGGQAALVKIFAAEQKRLSGGGDGPSPMRPGADQKAAPWGVKEGLATIQSLLEVGDRREAVRCALHYRLYSHALLLSLMCETKDVFEKVVQTMIDEQLDITSPLAHAYCIFNELPLPDMPKDALLPATSDMWIGHVSTLVANYTRDSGEAIAAWGDRLVEAGKFDAAHVCFLAAQLSPAGRPNPQAASKQQQQLGEALRTKYILLGGHYHRQRNRSAFVSPSTIFLTEVLEHSVQRDNEKFVRPQLIPFRVMMSCLMFELGLMHQGVSYLDQVLRVLPPTPAAGGNNNLGGKNAGKNRDENHGELPAVRFLVDVADQLKKFVIQAMQRSQGSRQASAGGSSSGWWPFGGRSGSATKGGASTTPPTAAADRQSTPPSQGVQRASGTKPLPAAAPAAAPTTPQSAEPEPSKPSPVEPQPRSSGGWSIGGLFRRGGSQGTSTTAKKDDKEVKKMIIDTDRPPEYDPVTGRYKFPKTQEEEEIERLTKSGPPKMAAPAAAMPQQQQQQQLYSSPGPSVPAASGAMGSPGQLPPPPPMPGGGGHAASKKYVDMFNS